MSAKATKTLIEIVNNTQYTISVRITNDNDERSTGFFDIEPGKADFWARSFWQVAFVLRNSVDPTDNKALTLVVRPTGVYYINDD
ncbi:uncharacterized protein F5147DRAFT_837978 [Suillus discolor]|uniref:Uncharacterized protein n=1 Tax=Suillus discolor TaxID=1912936 RepID=A0A9P7JSN4_9AGAM|nr:uncharacterized protein F5147DRAFT_837978 [Suillus discolor]KAG2105769.1 hypothetical protein F5147DRAFT_837978 [Suillus discolor]